MPQALRSLCFFVGAIVVLAVLYSSTTLPATASTWNVPEAAKGFTDKFKDETPPPASDPIYEDTPTSNPPTAVLGLPDKTEGEGKTNEDANAPAATATSMADALEEVSKTPEEFNDAKYAFQLDLNLTMCDTNVYDTHHLRKYMPKNFKGPGNPTFATYLSTRNGTTHDPYFMAAMQLTYRVLWDPRSKSEKYPLTVFVAPFIPQEHRDLLQASGAIVRELELIEWHPNKSTFGRWKDLFSKLNMWRQTDYTKIAFLDLDAFPFQNIDDIFDLHESQKCIHELLPDEDRLKEEEICDYTFYGTEVGGYKEINVGVMVFQPNLAMHARLTREFLHADKYDNFMAEQAFLSYAYRQDGPFPVAFVDRSWNGFFPQADEEEKLKIVHEKLWSPNEALPWGQPHFVNTHNAMCNLYESKEFRKMREDLGKKPF
ncbi:hypothetical protein AC579_4381 [Pseudocercospora musae]|uniref:Glycosyltransferase family 8 protein n=1 Tax=Pseudocercospora musae TaxID=113226 RepID=A0A139HTS9_9PEZI|nr:hypothetical protein AC579_4381 [Pseudocercospora musae]